MNYTDEPSFTGPEIVKIRERLGLTQEELGSLLGVTREWVGKLETEARPISVKLALRLQQIRREQESAPRSELNEPPQADLDLDAPLHGSADLTARRAVLLALVGSDAQKQRHHARVDFERILAYIGDDREMLDWLAVQMRLHLIPGSTPEDLRRRIKALPPGPCDLAPPKPPTP